jgi:hypothetical protein
MHDIQPRESLSPEFGNKRSYLISNKSTMLRCHPSAVDIFCPQLDTYYYSCTWLNPPAYGVDNASAGRWLDGGGATPPTPGPALGQDTGPRPATTVNGELLGR